MVVSFILSKIRSYLKYREMVRELSSLDDRALSDIGVSRSDMLAPRQDNRGQRLTGSSVFKRQRSTRRRSTHILFECMKPPGILGGFSFASLHQGSDGKN